LILEVRSTGLGVRCGDIVIGILVFADDIVLLAEGKTDLEKLMDVVWKYSQKWRFRIALEKSAVMIFEQKNDNKFEYGNCQSECNCGRHWRLGDGWIKEVQLYKYLGIEFNKGCTFEEYKERIATKARRNRVLIGLMNKKNGSLSVKANINLWESIIRAGMEYGAEVWGVSGEWEEGEVIQRETGRRILNCHRKAANLAVRGDLGWWKLSTRRYYLMMKYWVGLIFMKNIRITKRVYRQSRKLYLTRNKNNWVKVIHKLVQKYNLIELWNNEENIEMKREKDQRYWMKVIFENIQKVEEEEWKREVSIKSKLRLYKTFKQKLEFEKYLLVNKYKKGRNYFIALRTGSNKLRIETGRWKKQAEYERVCTICMTGQIENEKHFMLDCVAYENLREILFNNIRRDTEGKWQLETYTPIDQLKILLGGTGDKFHCVVAENVFCFVGQAMKRREAM
jgi:hypothetical protein